MGETKRSAKTFAAALHLPGRGGRAEGFLSLPKISSLGQGWCCPPQWMPFCSWDVGLLPGGKMNPRSLYGKGNSEVVGQGCGLSCRESPSRGCLYLPEVLLSSGCSGPWCQGQQPRPAAQAFLRQGQIKMKPVSGSWGAVSKVRGNQRSVNLRPIIEQGKAGQQYCRHVQQSQWPCPTAHPLSLLPSFPPSPLPVLGFGSGWMDERMNGWVGFSPCLGVQGQPGYQGHGEQKQLTPCCGVFEDQGGLGAGPARATACQGSGLLWVFIIQQFLLMHIRCGFGQVPR